MATKRAAQKSAPRSRAAAEKDVQTEELVVDHQAQEKAPVAKPRKATPAKSGKRRKRKRDSCFVISPFGGWHDEYHREIFCAAIKAAGLEPTRADDLFRSSNIVHDIWHLVSSSRVMLADLTDKNPNDFYELGLAHAARKPVLLLTQTMDDVPFDLRALRVITYDVQHPAWGDLLRENIEAGLRETLKSPSGSVLPTFLLETPTSQTKVSAEEKRALELQQQLDSLRAQVRALSGAGSRRRNRHPEIEPPEAEDLIQRFARRGMPDVMIVDELESLGVPEDWVRKQLVNTSKRSRK